MWSYQKVITCQNMISCICLLLVTWWAIICQTFLTLFGSCGHFSTMLLLYIFYLSRSKSPANNKHVFLKRDMAKRTAEIVTTWFYIEIWSGKKRRSCFGRYFWLSVNAPPFGCQWAWLWRHLHYVIITGSHVYVENMAADYQQGDS